MQIDNSVAEAHGLHVLHLLHFFSPSSGLVFLPFSDLIHNFRINFHEYTPTPQKKALDTLFKRL